MTKISRRAAIGLLGGGLLGLGLVCGYFLRTVSRLGSPSSSDGMMTGGMMGSATSADMTTYMDLFNRHPELQRTVEEVPGGVRTTTESESPDLVMQLQAHVSSMYSHMNQGAEVICMSNSLPTLFKNAKGYQRQLTLTSSGVSVTETSNDPALTAAILKHAQEVSGFVRDGMPAMMRSMMGG